MKKKETREQLLSRKVAEQDVTLLRLRGIKLYLLENRPTDTLELVDKAIKQIEGMIKDDNWELRR